MSGEFRTVGVVGLGTMGTGIAEVLARHGLRVIGVEVDEAAVVRARDLLRASTGRAVERGKTSPAERDELLSRIEIGCDFARLAPVELVIEAVPEHLALKREVFAQVDRIVAADAVLATNTSSLSVTELAVATENPRRVVGIHFFNPAPVQGFVEVVQTVVSEQQVVDDVVALVRRLGKEPVVVGDKAGFIANALLFGYLNHAVTMYEQKYAAREDIDAAMRLGCGLPMGPLALMDLIGLDTAYEILDSMYKQGRDRLHAPSPVIKQMVTAGWKGRKTGRGFYTYDTPGSSTVVPDALTPVVASSPERGRSLNVVGVIGSGTMAIGITEVFARAGFEVLVVARGPQQRDRVLAGLAAALDRQVAKGRLDPADRAAVLGRVTGSLDLEDLAGVDLALEAVVEDLEVKRSLFARLDRICRPGAILATTTSSLPVIDCAAATTRPQDVVGLHFFNPAPAMKLVEVVSTVSTAPEVAASVVEIARRLGKHPVSCADRAGFIVNALLFPYLNDAVRMLAAHYAQADDIDRAMKLGCGYPMGPFELLDVVGLDVSLTIERVLYEEFAEPGFAPSPLLEHMVTAGYLGRKTRRGFRTYA